MQNLPRISKQFQPMQRIPTKKPTVQKPCIDRIQQSSLVELGKKFEEGFYAKSESPSPQAVPAAGEPTISMTALLELLKNADPEVKAQLRLALLTCKIYHAFQSNSSPCRGFL